MNKAISWKTDEHFTDGKEYGCSCTYNNMIEVVDDRGELIQVGLDDPDFTIMLNVRTCDGCSNYGDFYKPECGECRISGKGKENNYSDESSMYSRKDCLACGIGTNESTYCNGCSEFSKWFEENNCKLCGSKFNFRMVQISELFGKTVISLSGTSIRLIGVMLLNFVSCVDEN